MFSHDCFSFNRLPRDEYKRIGQLEMKKDSKVFGNKVFGIYLLGKSPDYRFPTFMFFPHPDFGYKMNTSWCVHDGASLAFLTNSSDSSSHCYKVKRYNMDGMLTVNYGGTQIFCYREDQDSDFDSPWHKEGSLTAEDIRWHSCGYATSSMPSVPRGFEPEPIQLPDFRIIDPRLLSSQGSPAVMYKAKRKPGDVNDLPVFSKPNPPGSLFPGEPGWKDPSLMIHFHKPGAVNANNNNIDPTEITTMEPYQKFSVEIPVTDCEEVPRPPDTCNDPTTTNECEILTQALSLEDIDWTQDKIKEGSWRLPILNLVNSIYEKACPQVSKYFAAAISRIFQYFLTQAVEADPALETKFKEPKKREWLEIITDLERCNENPQVMKFFRKKNHAAVKLKKKLEDRLVKIERRMLSRIIASETGDDSSTLAAQSSLANDLNHTSDIAEIEKIQNQLNENPLKFPYKILIGSAERPMYSDARRVYQYREAAEIDHELDWALDSYWKITSTVLGYCNIHYASKGAGTFMRLYDSFTTDFFEYILKDWIKGDNMLIYEQIFGEFISGAANLWIDACHDGAYQWAGTVDLRPLRPIPLNEGEVVAPPPAPATGTGATGPTNFFVDNPAFLNDAVDYDDYQMLDISESEEFGGVNNSATNSMMPSVDPSTMLQDPQQGSNLVGN
ncbi:unnamed protein product [Orchesella dallaii]